MDKDTFHQTRLLKASSNLALNNSREEASTTSLGNLLVGYYRQRVCCFLLDLSVRADIPVALATLQKASLKDAAE